LENTYVLTNITSDQVVLFAREQSINKTIEEALKNILAQKKVIEDLEAQKTHLFPRRRPIYTRETSDLQHHRHDQRPS